MLSISDAIRQVERMMVTALDGTQMRRLHDALIECFVEQTVERRKRLGNADLLEAFLDAKRLEGCSGRSLKYYRSTLVRFVGTLDSSLTLATTEQIRSYLGSYGGKGGTSNVTIDNARRIISSFFSWLEAEDYIYKSPARRIKKIRTVKTVKETYSDEVIELMRDGCTTKRDLAIVDLLSSTGIRVGELVNLDREDIDFEARECIVLGKGGKERRVYFDARTKLHLVEYLSERNDNNPALFVSLCNPNKRLQISGVEIRLRELGRRLGICRVHPHKFRRTLATRAIDKGMPIEQVQVLLGHQKIDTTLRYAMVDQRNVRMSHRRYIA